MIATKQYPSSSTERVARPSTQAIGIKPRRADLVEDYQTGQLYLRAVADGHFYWQPVTRHAEAIPDQGAWRTGPEYYQAYWINLGTFRRRADHYFAMTTRGPATQAA
jgi:hypothetical protein